MTSHEVTTAAPVTVSRVTAEQIVERSPGVPDALRPALQEVAASTERLLTTVRSMSDDAARAPSLLPGWTRGHVLTHLARNADGLVNLATWASTGVEHPMYPGGREGRDADIEAGAGRPVAELLADLEASAGRLLRALTAFPEDGLDRLVRTGSGAELPGRGIPLGRIREIEIHHVDLGLDYTPAHWPLPFVDRTLDELAELFRTKRQCPVAALRGTRTERTWRVGGGGPVLTGQEPALLAWLTGRSSGDGLLSDTGDAVPAAPTWV